jgi:hypothetical protein
MKKFVCLYRVPVETMEEWKKTTSPEEMQRQGKELGEKMMAWSKAHEGAFVGQGLPLGKNTRLTKDGAQPMTNDLNYMEVIQAENIEAVLAMFKDNPHFAIPSSFLDIMEVPEMKM